MFDNTLKHNPALNTSLWAHFQPYNKVLGNLGNREKDTDSIFILNVSNRIHVMYKGEKTTSKLKFHEKKMMIKTFNRSIPIY